MALAGNKDFQAAYTAAGGTAATFDFPSSGNDSWPYFAAQLAALKPDLIATINR
jgi:diacylglycerol O-acyltransferase/trehalose O-mycolyltransferase